MDENTLRGWYERILSYAKTNYHRGGWDGFVDCITFEDFKRSAFYPDPATGKVGYSTFDEAFEDYREWCGLNYYLDEDDD